MQRPDGRKLGRCQSPHGKGLASPVGGNLDGGPQGRPAMEEEQEPVLADEFSVMGSLGPWGCDRGGGETLSFSTGSLEQ